MRFSIDEKKKAEEEKLEHIKSLKEMLFITSHQVRHPLVTILGLTNQLEDYKNSKEELTKIVGYIKESALILDKQIKKLTLYISEVKKIENDKLPHK